MANGNQDDIVYDVDLNLKDFQKHKKQLDNSFKKTQKRADTTTKSMESGFNKANMAVGALAVGTVALSTAIAGVGAITKKMISETGQLETATVKWETLIGTVDGAEAKIKQVFEFSNKTPFTFKGVNEAATTLYNLSNGVLQTEEDLRRLGDASAKGGVKIEELAVTYGRLYQKFSLGEKSFADEINRMSELGIITGETKQQLQQMSKSQLLSGEAWTVFEKGADKARGMMEKLSGTIEGKLSTLEGVWDGVFAFDDKGVQDSIKASIDVLINTLNNNKDSIQNVIADVFGVLTDFTEEWIDGALKIYNLFKSEDSTSNTIAGVKSGSITRTDILNEKTGLQRDLGGLGSSSVQRDILGGIAKSSGLQQGELASIFTAVSDNNEEQLSIYKTTFPSMKDSIETLVKIAQKQARIDELTKIDALDLYKKATVEPNGTIKKAGGVGTGTGTGEADTSGFNIYTEQEERERLRSEYEQRNAEIEQEIANMKQELVGLGATTNESEFAEELAKKTPSPSNRDGIGGANQIVQATDQGFKDLVSIHESWSKNSLKNFANIGQALSSSAGGIAGGISSLTGSSLGSLIPGLGLATSAFGLLSSVSGLFDDESDTSSADTFESNQTERADIVSQGVDTIIVNADFSVYTTYADAEGMDTLFNEQIAPRIGELYKGVY